MKWDEEVDVVCTGSGIAGLAHAMAVVDMGGEVFVADPRGDAEPSGIRCGPFARRPAALARGGCSGSGDQRVLRGPVIGPWPADPVRAGRRCADQGGRSRRARRPERCASRRSSVPGSGTGPHVAWCRRMATSTPACLIGGRPLCAPSMASRSRSPKSVRSHPIPLMSVARSWTGSPHRRATGASKYITASPLQRIVFEEGDVVGAVFKTPDGPLAVRARHGVTVASGGPQVNMAAGAPFTCRRCHRCACAWSVRPPAASAALELLTSEPLTQGPASNCRPMNRQLHANLHETHSHLQTWRCGKVNGYPSLGQ